MVALALALTGCGGSQPAAKTAEPAKAAATAGAASLPGTIKIGAILPITGPEAEHGKSNTYLLKMLEKEVNDAGGINGAKLQVIIYDTGWKADQAGNLIRRLAQDDKVLAIAGPLSSFEAEVAFKAAVKEEIVAASYASSKPGLSKENRPWVFRNTLDEGMTAAPMVEKFVKKVQPKSVAIIHDAKDAISTAIGKAILPPLFEKAGVKVVNKDNPITFQTGDIDLQAQVTKLKSLNPDGIIFGAFQEPAQPVLNEMKRQNMTVPTIGGTPLISTEILKPAPDIPLWANATYFFGMDKGRAKAWSDKAKKIYVENNHKSDPDMFDVNLYELVEMYIDAIKKGGVTNKPEDLKADRVKIRDYMAKLKDFQGISGRVGFNADGDGDKAFYVVVGHKGKWQVED